MCTLQKALKRTNAPSLCYSAPLQTEKHTYIMQEIVIRTIIYKESGTAIDFNEFRNF